MKVTNVAQILRDKGRSKPVEIEVKSLGESLLFKKLTVGQAKEYTFGMIGKDQKPDMAKVKDHKVKLVQMSIVDTDGIKQTTEVDLNDIDNDVLEELFAICQDLNGFGKKDEGNG